MDTQSKLNTTTKNVVYLQLRKCVEKKALYREKKTHTPLTVPKSDRCDYDSYIVAAKIPKQSLASPDH